MRSATFRAVDNDSPPAIPAEVLDALTRLVRELRFGSIEIVVHEGRITQMAAITAQLMGRTGALLDVARQAAAVEPEIAAAAQAGRDDTRRTLHQFWQRAADDGLLPAGANLDWLRETATVIAHADTYLLLRATTRWDVSTYQQWLTDTWHRLVLCSSESNAGP